ncbi:protein ACTIVITY OF BC1 COMPLEX KINASE 8, chloroplastic-like [Cajanus cajan]|uniref:protein ACTIVITY OF BC1 COMPLEX KINASE 8, chloroplastic-like n=1 Tax=Cajanus cajan TaxID=3821 RepID=UPI0010FAF485|nr:protein ACTIVITY OF BC1 COMPLEX KINASE 8, chloroplastic-like [Cajanus cajan]
MSFYGSYEGCYRIQPGGSDTTDTTDEVIFMTSQLAIAADQPFRFPATFTFVVRAFSVLDGIGKGLDPRFDITEIAKPYALELLKFREAGVEVIIKDFRKRWDRQSQAFYNLFRQAERVEKLAEIIQKLEQGDLKLRVRTLESERAFQRIATVQKTIGNVSMDGL